MICIYNAQLVFPDVVKPGALLIKGKKIVAVSKRKLFPRDVTRINARGNFLAPGFIDLHIHGDIDLISRQQARGGTTGFLATLHPARPQALLKGIAQVLARKDRLCGAKVLGLRLEGPFLNREFCGALPPEFLRLPNVSEARDLIKQAGGSLKMVILAPECKDALSLIRLLKKHKVVASLGHTGATFAQTQKGIDAGITHATHTFNRMRAFDHRNPGALGAALTDNRVSCEVIVDGVHVHPAALKLLIGCKGLDMVILITDSTVAQKHPLKKRLGNVFRLKDGTLYGTALTLNKALKNSIKFLGLSLAEAVRLATLNPARVLGIDRRKGSIAVGKDADLVIFDRNLNVKLAMVEGQIVYKK